MGYRLIIIALISLAPASIRAEQNHPSALTATEIPVERDAPSSQQAPLDVRIAIDTSGSMKQTDPKNLRRPALKLLVNLLPSGSRTGVWLFDSQPRPLITVSTVNKAWKTQAEHAAESIHSRGAFTHIEAALSSASAGWEQVGGEGQHRHLILLTDGKVDISKNPSENSASRARILGQELPRLQQAGVEIHTIALSDQSDKALMGQLALSTGGWHTVAQNAEQIQRGFVQLFNKAAPHDNIPIRENRFSVDASVEEFTLLAWLQEGAQATRLTAPGGRVLSAARPGAEARWLHEAGYDLVTVPHPAAGEWRLEANQDPENQVLVIAHLKMEPVQNPNYLEAGEKPIVAVSLTEDGRPITREDFLALLNVKGELATAGAKRELVLSRDPQRPGTFAAEVTESLAAGDYTLTIRADGKTFQRETQQTFRVLPELLRVETQPDPSANPPGLIIRLTPDSSSLMPNSVTVRATLTDQSGQTRHLAAERDGTSLRIALPAPTAGERWIVNFTATGQTPDGAPVEIPLQALTLSGPAVPVPADAPRQSGAAAQPPEPDWPKTIGIAVGINLALLLACVTLFRIMRKRREAAITRLLSKLSA